MSFIFTGSITVILESEVRRFGDIRWSKGPEVLQEQSNICSCPLPHLAPSPSVDFLCLPHTQSTGLGSDQNRPYALILGMSLSFLEKT
jgi:hypothetical protein